MTLYDPYDLNNPTWVRYRWCRRAWWLSLTLLIALAVLVIAGKLNFFVLFVYIIVHGLFSTGVSYLSCPMCNEPVGQYTGLAKHFIRPSSLGGSCLSCGAKLYGKR
jgi:hypothetical protein